MGRPNIFEISLTNMNGMFYPGDPVDGHVTVELVRPKKMIGIQLKCKGKALVQWQDGNDRCLKDEEKYFVQKVLLCGERPDEEESGTMELPCGRHTFPFRFQLPNELPPSFSAFEGSIYYSVSARINRPYKTSYETIKPFTVLSNLDLNSDPTFAEHVAGNKEKHLCYLCCKSGPISAQFSIERKGWVPGEAIKLYASISNGTSWSIEKSSVKLIKVSTFYAQHEITRTWKTIAVVSRPLIPGFGEDSWMGEELVVPPLPPSFLAGCSIIDVEYFLQLGVEASAPATNLKVALPIVIGTIPLMSVNPQASQGAAQGDWSASAPPNTPPPSYKDYMTGLVDGSDAGDTKSTKDKLSSPPTDTYDSMSHTPVA